MTEAVTAVVVSTTASTAVTAAVLGASPEAIVLGFIGALAASVWQADFDHPRKTYGGIAFGMLLGGWGTPSATDWALHQHWIGHITADNLKLMMPILIGASIPLIGAPLLAKLRTWLGATNG